jgi:hypothetical protein
MKNEPKIILAYPCGTGGHFLASLMQLIKFNTKPSAITNTGSMHEVGSRIYQPVPLTNSSTTDDVEIELSTIAQHLASSTAPIFIGHFRGLKYIKQLYPKNKIFYVTVAESDFHIQEQNFIKKIMIPNWSQNWYNVYKTESWPAFEELPRIITDINELPELVHDGILTINRKYIAEWIYDLPDDHDDTCELPMSLITRPEELYNKLLTELDAEHWVYIHARCQKFINNYIKANGYETR